MDNMDSVALADAAKAVAAVQVFVDVFDAVLLLAMNVVEIAAAVAGASILPVMMRVALATSNRKNSGYLGWLSVVHGTGVGVAQRTREANPS